MSKTIQHYTICFVFAFLFMKAKAQVTDSLSTDTNHLEEVVVTATRTERQLSALPLPVQLIAKTEIKAINAIRLTDLLAEQTGITTVPDFGGGEGLQMQGFDSEHILILIDGMPVIGRSAGTLDLNRITTGNVARIEVVKGASSSLYGSDALGGVVNIITENPKEGFGTTLNYRGGSFNSHDANIDISYKKNAFSISGFGNRYENGGYDLVSGDGLATVTPSTAYTGGLKLGYDFSESTRLSASAKYFNQLQDYEASATLKGESELNEYTGYVKLDHKYSDTWKSFAEVYVTRYKADEYLNDLEADNSLSSSSYFDQLMVRPEVRFSYQPGVKHTFLLGAGYTYERLDRTDFSTTPENKAPYVYAQYETQLTDKLSLIAGGRFDAHNNYASQFSPKLALGYQLNSKILLKASAGYGYKAPDFRQLYFNFSNSAVGYTVLGYNVVSNILPELQANGEIAQIKVPLSDFQDKLNPESALDINLGMSYRVSKSINVSLNVFRNDIKNLIDTRTVATKSNGQAVFSYYNVNRVYYQGLEASGTYTITKNFKLTGGYQLLYAMDKSAIEHIESGEVYARVENSPSFALKKKDYFGLFNRSRHMANIKLFYNNPKWKLNANVRGTYRSKYGLYDTNDSQGYLDDYDTFVSGYSIWDVAVNKTLWGNYTLGIGADNFLNFTDTQNISNISGRILYGKITIQF